MPNGIKKLHVLSGITLCLCVVLCNAEGYSQNAAPAPLGTSADVDQLPTPGLEGDLSAEIRKLIQTDPLKAARPVKANIDTWGSRVAKSVQEFEERVQALDLHRIDHQRLAVTELRHILDDVQQAADSILEGYAPFQTNVELYARALAQAPPTFTALAESFQKKAGEQDHQDLAGVYADFAETSRRLAKKYLARRQELLRQQQDVEQKIRFVRQSKLVIKDVQELLEVIPATEEGEVVETYIRRINEYVDGFLKVIQAVKGTADKIGEPKPSASPEKPIQPPSLQGRRQEQVAPPSLAEVRSRLTRMQR